ncbi:PepSY domain-containing protein [Alkalibaculum bacchi]|uniref:PepSY domain-containing protein n=1 Tax=Alkalibaculum bacchi TaxID=645887 RepID=UPI0026EF5272|nr:PepSY domain-containing protein [Alkalibaculum bacchi]
MIKKRWIIFIVLVLAITLPACTGNSPNNNSNDEISKEDSTNTYTNPDSDINNTGTITNVVYEDIKLTPGEVFNIYVKKYPNVKVNKLALDFDRGLYIYEVEGYDDTNKYELKIEPVDGEILKEEQKQRDDNDTEGEITIENVNKIQELMDKALKDAGNGYKVDEWELKFENGQSIFEIEVVDDNDHDIEYKYNINTMELIEKDQ